MALTEDRFQKAQALRKEGYSCSQAVIAVLADALEISEDQAFGFAGGFGGGMRTGEVCGAASAAVMAIGLRYGQRYPNDAAAKAQCGLVTGQFMQEFAARMGNVRCRDLLGGSMQDPTAAARIAEAKKTVCPQAIRMALEILEELGF